MKDMKAFGPGSRLVCAGLTAILYIALPAQALASGAALSWPDPIVKSAEDGLAYYETYKLARKHYADDRFEQALPLLEDLVGQQPGDPGLWGRLGRAREMTGDADGAIDAYRTALKIGYRFTPWIAHRIARLHGQEGRTEPALEWLERALAERHEDRPELVEDEAFDAFAEQPRFAQLAGNLPEREFSRDEGWRYDLDFLVKEARRMHAGPDRPAFSDTFSAQAAALRERIPELSNDRILLELRRLLVLLGDGHTGIHGPGPETPLEFSAGDLPLLFYRFDDGLYVVDAADNARQWIGARVLAFGSVDTEAALDALADYTPADNPMTVTWIGVRWVLRDLAFLQAIGATDDATRATLALRDREGREREVEFAGGDLEFRRKLRPPPDAAKPPPAYLRDVDREYWLEPRVDHDAVYFQFNQVRHAEDGPDLAEFATALHQELEETGAQYLIVDVRHNNGGNNGLLEEIVQTLIWWEQAAPGHRIFVLTGRNTFSAAQNFINRVERWTDAVFVGEPSSSSPNFSGEETSLVLPYSRVRGSISTRYWQDSDPGDLRPWIAPRLPVTLSSEDYFANRDPVLRAVLQLIDTKREEPVDSVP